MELVDSNIGVSDGFDEDGDVKMDGPYGNAYIRKTDIPQLIQHLQKLMESEGCE